MPMHTPPRYAFDDLDRQLIKLLFDDAEMSVADLAKRIRLTVGPCRTRVQRLFESGLLERRNAVPEDRSQWQSVRLVTLKFPDNTADTLRTFADRVRDMPNVIACDEVSGFWDVMVRVAAKDVSEFNRVRNLLVSIFPQSKTETTEVLRETKRYRLSPESLREYRAVPDQPVAPDQ